MPRRFSSSAFFWKRVKAQIIRIDTTPTDFAHTHLHSHPLPSVFHTDLIFRLPQILNKARVAAGVGIRDKDRGSRFLFFFILFVRSSRFLSFLGPGTGPQQR